VTYIAPDAPLFDVDELVRRLNAATRPRSDGRLRWSRWKALRRLQKTRAHLVQPVAGGKVWWTAEALRATWPDLYGRLVAAPPASTLSVSATVSGPALCRS